MTKEEAQETSNQYQHLVGKTFKGIHSGLICSIVSIDGNTSHLNNPNEYMVLVSASIHDKIDTNLNEDLFLFLQFYSSIS